MLLRHTCLHEEPWVRPRTRPAWSCLMCGFSSLTWIQTAVVALTKPQDHDGNAYTEPSCPQWQAAGPCRYGTSGPALFKPLWNSTASDYGNCLVQCILKHWCPISSPVLLCFSHPELGIPALLPACKNPCTYCSLIAQHLFWKVPQTSQLCPLEKSLLWCCSKSYMHFIFFSSSKYLLDICIFIWSCH